MTGYQDNNPSNDHQATYSFSLQWHHNEHDGVSNQRHFNCLLNRWFRSTSMKTLKLHVTGLCEGNSPVTSEFPAKKASNAEKVSVWWCHHNKLCSKVSNQWGYHFTLLCDLLAQTGSCLLILIFFYCQTGQYSLQGSFWVWPQAIRDEVTL